MSKSKPVIVRRKGKNIEISRWVHEFNQRKKRERLARKKLDSGSNRLK